MITLTRPWKSEITRSLVMLFLFWLFGVMIGHVSAALLSGLLIYMGWMIYNLYRLDDWLRSGAKKEPPDAPGIWGEIFRQYYLIKQKEKRRKKRLASVLKQFRATTSAMPDAAVVLNNSYEIEWINEASISMLGFHPKRDVGQRVDNFLRQPEFVRYLNVGNFEESIELLSPVTPGQFLSVRLVRFGKKQYLMVVLDVTETHRVNAMRRDFVANTSHELRSPLTVLQGYLENMEEVAEGELSRWKRPLQKMQKQTGRMIRIVDDMLFLSRVENPEQAPRREVVDVPTLLVTIADEARELSLQQNGGERDIHLNAERNLKLNGEESELYAAFSNLIFNAVKYTPHDGEIHISWKMVEEGPRFRVEDSGIGIPAEHLPRLTERFYRVDAGRSREKGGTGLGLAIVRHVVNHHGAEFTVQSQQGVGSTFSITFPPQRAE